MIKTEEKTDLNQISLTGTRAIVLLGLLVEKPRTLEEIREAFIKFKIMEPEHSDDILRIDLNTLRTMGCEISKATKKTGYRYVLSNHPFALNITKEEILVLKRAYKRIKNTANLELILQFDLLFKKLAKYIGEQEIREIFSGLSALKHLEPDFVINLTEDCSRKNILHLSYKTPSAKKDSMKEIAAQKLVFRNDKVYLYGFDMKKNKSVILNIERIREIFHRDKGSGEIKTETVNVKFFLKNFELVDIEENEKIIDEVENGYIIEGKYYNDFLAAQRILSFGANCTVLEPESFKQQIIQKLKSMRSVYNDRNSR